MIIGPAIGQEKAKVENIIVWDLWSNQNYQKIPELKQPKEHNDVSSPKEKNGPVSTCHSGVIQKTQEVVNPSGSKGRALGM